MALVVYQGPQSYDQSEDTKVEISEGSKQFVGLSNQGATCYLNGLLQTLFMTPDFRQAIFKWNYDPVKDGSENFCIPLQLQRLFGQLQLSNQKSVDTIALTKSFGWEGSEVFQQQDVQELTRVLFDALEETFKGTEVENIIDELYAGELIDYIRCIDVDYQSERVDKFLDFSLAIVPFGSNEPMHTLTECIEMFLRPEILDGENKYYAEKFDQKVDAIKGLKFGKLPKIMSVQLKRFVYDFSGPMVTQKKLNDMVKFPMVLDMNKYVAKKVNKKSESNQDNEVSEEENGEFERFLMKQIELLKSQREKEQDPLYQPPYKNDDFNEIDLEVKKGNPFDPAYYTSDHPSPSTTEDKPIENVDPTSVSPTTETETDTGDPEVLYDSLTEQEIMQLISTRGEWIYELYAVLVHSGVSSGGHYYAYIKDLDSQQWYNFNDSNVTPVSEKTVQTAWGGNNVNSGYSTPGNYYSGQAAQSLYGRSYYPPTYNSLSSANGYMLMYRKFSKNRTSSVLLTLDIVPKYIRDLVEEEERKRQKAWEEQQEYLNRLNVKVQWGETEYVVAAKKYNTYKELLSKIWEKLDLLNYFMNFDKLLEIKKNDPKVEIDNKNTTEPEAEDTDGDYNSLEDESVNNNNTFTNHSGFNTKKPLNPIKKSVTAFTQTTSDIDVPAATNAAAAAIANKLRATTLHTVTVNTADGNNDNKTETTSETSSSTFPTPFYHLFRLRNYNCHTKLLADIFEYEVLQDKVLSELGFNDYKMYYLETRREEEEWEVYYDDGISLLLELYDAGSCTFSTPKSIRLPKNATLLQLKQVIEKWATWGLEEIRVMKFSNMGFNDARMEILRNDELELKDHLGVYDGQKLYVERCEGGDPGPSEDPPVSLAFESFLNFRNRLEVRINTPPHTEFDRSISADGRWKISDLRRAIAQELGLSPENTRLFKQTLRGQELKNVDNSLSSSGIYAGICVAVCEGKVTPPGFVNIELIRYQPESNKVGIIPFPELEPEISEEENVDLDDEDYEELSKHFQQKSNSISISSYHYQNTHSIPPSEDVARGEGTNQTGTSVGNDSLPPLIDCENGEGGEDWYKGYSPEEEADLENLSNEGVADESERFYQNPDDDDDEFFGEDGIFSEDLLTKQVGSSEGLKNSYVAGGDILDLAQVEVRGLEDLSKLPPLVDIGTTSTGVVNPTVVPIPVATVDNFDWSLEKEQMPVPTTATAVASGLEQGPVGGAGKVSYLGNTDIQPSGFGEMTVKNGNPSALFSNVEELNDVFVQGSTLVDELRDQLTSRLITLGLLPEGASSRRIRLREKVGNNPGKILRDGRTLMESQIYLYDHKQLVFEILDHEEEFPELDPSDVLVLVQKWQRSTWDLGERFEVLLKGNMSVRDISRGLCKLLNIPLESVKVMVVPKDTEFFLSELTQKSPSRNYGRSWFNPTQEKKLLRYMSHDMRVQDGDLLLLQDSDEGLKELSPADLKSMEIVEAAATSPYLDFWSQSDNPTSYGGYQTSSIYDQLSSTGSQSKSVGFSSLSNTYSSRAAPTGVKIKTHKERLKEIEANENSNIETELGHNLLQLDENFGNNKIAGRASPVDASAFYNDEIRFGDTDEKEFQKQGGFALFDDINY